MKAISITDEDHKYFMSIKGKKSFADVIHELITVDELEKIKITISKPLSINKSKSLKCNDDVNKLIKFFQPINPAYDKLYSNTTQREAIRSLLRLYSFQNIESIIKLLPDVIVKPYAPRITTPHELLTKLGSLMAFIKQEEGKSLNIII